MCQFPKPQVVAWANKLGLPDVRSKNLNSGKIIHMLSSLLLWANYYCRGPVPNCSHLFCLALDQCNATYSLLKYKTLHNYSYMRLLIFNVWYLNYHLKNPITTLSLMVTRRYGSLCGTCFCLCSNNPKIKKYIFLKTVSLTLMNTIVDQKPVFHTI